MERNLIRILGRKEIPGRPLIYATTKLFLEIFGLKDLKELPTPAEIESLDAYEGQKNPLPETDDSHSPNPEQPGAEKDPEETGELNEDPSIEQIGDQTGEQISDRTGDSQAANPPDIEHGDKPVVPVENPDETVTPANEKALDEDNREDYKRDDSSESGG
jgi:segregation and condensation protein B